MSYLKSLPLHVAEKAPDYAFFFIMINSGIAVVERLLSINFFPIPIGDQLFEGQFRSTALLGHPLNNALITFIFLLFVLLIRLNTLRKGFYLLILLLALLCFGARASLYVSIFSIFILYIIPVFFSQKKYFVRTNKASVVFLLVAMSAVVVYLVLFTPFGARLVQASFFDESAGARVKAFDLVDLSKPSQYLWSKSQQEIENLTHIFDVFIIENFIIIWLLKFGLIFMSILIAGLFSFLFFINLVTNKVYRFN